MSKEVAISKKDKALAVKSMSTFELAVCERKAVLSDLKTEIETAPIITLENGDTKKPDAKGWQLKISNKIISVFGSSCKDIDKIENVFLSNAVRNIRLEAAELWRMFKKAGNYSEVAYNGLLLKADELIESAKEHYDNRMTRLGRTMSNELFAVEESAELKVMEMEFDALYNQFEFLESQGAVVAARMGAILINMKQTEPTGMFYKKVTEKYPRMSDRRAREFMQLAREMPELLERRAPAALKLTQAILLSSASDELKETVIERIENGEEISTREIQRLKREAQEAKEKLEKSFAYQKELAVKLDSKQGEIAALTNEKWKLENQQQQIIDAKVSEEKAKLILENQQAIAEAKRLAENAQGEIEKLKKERETQIKNGIEKGLQDLDVEIKNKQSAIDYQRAEIEKLSAIKRGLDVEVGALAVHKKAIEKIKDNLSFLTVSFSDAFETSTIPHEVAGEWDAIYFALSKLKKQMSEWRDSKSPIDSFPTIEGELVEEFA